MLKADSGLPVMEQMLYLFFVHESAVLTLLVSNATAAEKAKHTPHKKHVDVDHWVYMVASGGERLWRQD